MMEKEVFVFPTSLSQQRLWFLDQLEPAGIAYNLPAAFRLTGPLNVAALEQSLGEIIRRHEALRTTFAMVNQQPNQVIASAETFRLSLVDLQKLHETEREAEAQRFANEEAQRRFDLTRGPLFRASLLRLGEEDHVFLVTMHHIVSDGWSIGVFAQELSALYQAFCKGQPSPLAELPIQYADFAVWQRQWMQGEVLEKQLSYWKGQLAGAPPVVNLPTDRPRPAVQTFRGARHSVELPKGLTEGLKELSRREGVSLFMTLLAAFQILLCRYTGQEDIVVGSPIAGRNRSEIESLIGFFISTLVLRTDLSGNPTFRELLGRVREVCLGAYAHQDLPFEKLVEELQPERDLSHTPLFQVFFNMINLVEDRTVKLAGLKTEPFGSEEEASKFDLTMYVRDQGERLWFSLVYNTDLFDAATITRMLGHYRTLLQGIVANPGQPISSFPLLTEAERSQLSTRTNLIRATNPFTEFSKEEIEQSIPRRFEQQVERYPDHMAVKTKEHHWSYRELNRMANQTAQSLLRACGSGEQRVGLLFRHGAPMVAGILGVLKAAKTYVPLDPAYPTERLAYILEDSQATVLLTDNSNVGFARTLTNGGLQLINIDETQEAESADNPDLAISPDTLAYILYTSGSTGQPKGVMQNHRNVLHFIRAYTNNLHLNAGDKLTFFSSYSHDAAIVDIFGALLNGATLYPWGVKEQGLDGLAEWLIEEKVTIYHSTPTLYQSFVDILDQGVRFSELRAVVLGGETVLKSDFVRFKERFSPECIFFNLYGSTESTINLLYSVNSQSEVTKSALPLGYPVEATEILLLDKAGGQAEMYGEIGIRSTHVALGYWREPEMTEAAFQADPEGGRKKIYRTGDIGRLLPDGSIGFIGRKDFQVKVRGFRIELGEVEAVLSEHPGVKESVVVAREEKGTDPSAPLGTGKRLVAYVVSHLGQRLANDELRSFLKRKLPEYMVPSAFVMLDALPLTPNGKVNRRSLPAPDQTRPELSRSFVVPRTELERTIARIWREELNLGEVGIHDNFFDLGGHSLLIVKIASKLGAALNKDISIVQMFKYPTIQLLAAHLSQLQDKKPSFAESQQRAAARRESVKRRRQFV